MLVEQNAHSYFDWQRPQIDWYYHMWPHFSFNQFFTQLVDDLDLHSTECKLLSEADYYGATAEIAYAIGRKTFPRSYSNWVHGWAGLMPLRNPNLLSVSGNKQQTHLVHTIEQKEFLTKHGFSSVYAVGMPVIYTRDLSAEICRFKGSLLVMPPHVSKFSRLNFDEKKYVDYINQISSRFERVVVGITRECFEQRKWIDSFSRAGYEVIISANLYDSNALPKLKLLFSLFDYVTSPNLGSQFIYASLFGCRVSLAGPRLEVSKQELGQDPYYKRNPDILEFMFSEELLNFQERIEERFQADPWEAVSHQSYAECEAGSENKRSASDMSNLLGWDFKSQVTGISNRIIQRFEKVFFKPFFRF